LVRERRALRSHNQSLYEGKNIGLPYTDLHTLRSRYFGGSTNCWGGWCRPLNAIDFEKRDWVPYSGWPFSKATLEPYYDRAHVLCNVGPNNYDLDFWADTMSELNLSTINLPKKRIISQISQLSKERRFGVAYKDGIKTAAKVQAYLNANVAEIEASDDATSITSVRATTFSGNEFRVSAKLFVLATGGLENPRLMLLSNRVQKAGLGNQNDLVGRFFMEHPRIQTGEIVLSDPEASTNLYDVQYTYFHSPISANLALSEETQRAEQILNYKTWILSVYRGEESKGAEALKNLYRACRKTTMPDHFMDTSPAFWLRNIGTMLADFPNTAAVAIGRLSKHPGMIKKREFAHLCESVPDPESRITLGLDKDRLGLNRIRLNWRLSQLEKRTIRRGQEIIGEELTRSGLGRVTGEPLGDSTNEWPPTLLWGWHQMGTTRMHVEPKQGVVDENCRVHGFSNLFIGGSSVFPTSGSDLPTMTIVALALRLADHLDEQLRSPQR
jgi:choline dehydrogenase-like flavoprotein